MLALLILPAVALAQNQQPLYSTYSFNPLQHLAGIAPYFEPATPPRDPVPPQGCSVSRAAYLVRHAAINANSFDYETYMEPFTDKLMNTTEDWSKIPVLDFLSTWTPPDIEEEREEKLQKLDVGLHVDRLQFGVFYRMRADPPNASRRFSNEYEFSRKNQSAGFLQIEYDHKLIRIKVRSFVQSNCIAINSTGLLS